ncbi:RNA polymerase III subunit I isoform X1 [Oratosquilla oratoria]|uniref:RNA polymerase III subunit I isoform X1 n=1 Tax=Oratosquilla oratoria TaxID=337810 RepID=UPI003F764FEC
MEVINSKSAVLSNFEVYSLLQDLSQRDSKGPRSLTKTQMHLANIAFDTLKYLEKTACRSQNPEVIHAFLNALKDYKLTKAEKLQLLNLRPTTPVHMQLIIEDSEERLSEEQVEELLDIVQRYLPDENGAPGMVNGGPTQASSH